MLFVWDITGTWMGVQIASAGRVEAQHVLREIRTCAASRQGEEERGERGDMCAVMERRVIAEMGSGQGMMIRSCRGSPYRCSAANK